jgi:hypothetical protein
MQVMSTVAEAATTGALQIDHLRDPRMQLVGDAAAAVAVLMMAIVLSIFKPEGRTPFGWASENVVAVRTPMTIAFWITLFALVGALIVRHWSGGLPHH